jgi:hypothetical protein
MRRRLRLGIALVALTLHALLPFAAYASTQPVPGFNDLCSVYGKTAPVAGGPTDLPLRSGSHALSHCASCPGGSAAAAIPPPAVPSLLIVTASAQSAPVALRAAIAAAPILFPPPRGPPASLASV